MERFRLLAIACALAVLSACATGPSKSDRAAWVAAHPSIPARYRQAIIAGKIMLGMTRDEVRAAWGDPCGYCYGTTHNSWGDSWEYNALGSADPGDGTIVYFAPDGTVSAVSGP